MTANVVRLMLKTTPPPALDGACSRSPEPDLWFSDDRFDKRLAIAICQACVSRAACLQYAVENREQGVWGATTDEQRASLRRAQTRRRPA